MAQPVALDSHGLLGHYYAASLEPNGADYKGIDYDAFWLPTVRKKADAERVDAQIAFGKNNGFALDDRGQQQAWYAVPKTAAVIWTGYIRFPAAGTYHLATVSHNASAVYLNGARIALNGGYGGAAPHADFEIDAPGVDVLANPDSESYTVPITVDAPRVLPITVALTLRNASSIWGFGIDLYWTRPDSPTGPAGKPLAEIVPSDVLYPNAPERIEPTTTSAARSSLTADKLYFFRKMTDPVNVRVRLVDREGKPLAGRHVHLSALTDKGKAGVTSEPPPTDANGVTNALLTPGQTGQDHVTTIYATDVDDWVDVAETAAVDVIDPTAGAAAFFANGYSPYDDEHALQIVPAMPIAGQPAHFTVSLRNPLNYAASLYVILRTHEFNIGVSDWREIARSERVTLQPGESHVFEFTWTPESATNHQCFGAVVAGTVVQAAPPPAAATPMPRVPGLMATPARFERVDWRLDQKELLAQKVYNSIDSHGRESEDDTTPLIPPDPDSPYVTLAHAERNVAIAGVLGWAGDKLREHFGSVPLAPGVGFDPANGSLSAGTGVDVNVGGRDVVSFNVSGSANVDKSSDPHKVGSVTGNASVGVLGYHYTVASGTLPVNVNGFDPATTKATQYARANALNATIP